MNRETFLQEMEENLREYLEELDNLLLEENDLVLIHELTNQLYEEVRLLVEE